MRVRIEKVEILGWTPSVDLMLNAMIYFWWKTEESEEQDVFMNRMDLVDTDSTKWVWNVQQVWNDEKNFEKRSKNCSENM